MGYQQEINIYYLAILKDTVPILEIDFQSEGLTPETVLLTGFVSAINSFSKEFIKGELKTIDQGDYKLTLVEGKNLSILVLSSLISEDLRNQIKIILSDFEEKYSISLNALNLNSFEYNEFKEKVIAEIHKFKYGQIKEYYIPIFGSNKEFSSLKPDSQIIYLKIDGIRSVIDIAKTTQQTVESTMKILTSLAAHGFVDFKIIVDGYDIPKMTTLGLKELFNSPDRHRELLSILGKEWNQIIKKIDGNNSVKKLAERFSISLYDVCQVMSQLIKKDYITVLSDEIKLCLMLEKFYSRLYNRIIDIMGDRGRSQFIKTVESEPDFLRNLIIFDNNQISFDKLILQFEDQNNLLFDDIAQSLTPPINKIFKIIEKFHGTKYMLNLKTNNIEELKKEYREYDVNLLGEFLN